MIHVFKFGGASVKDAEGVKNLAKIVDFNKDKKILIVVSAMGKTTNALEQLTAAYVNGDQQVYPLVETVKNYHYQLANELFTNPEHPIFNQIANTFVEIDWMLEEEPHPDYDFNYDQIVSIGELLSTHIVSAYLNDRKLTNRWTDARSYIHTDNTYREGIVNWDKTCDSIHAALPAVLDKQFIVTQGFIGGTSENFTTTLGREGSDYTAAIFASCLKAESLTIWKDVPGVLNTDPKLFTNTKKYDELSYAEALEMTYYGATVIHPKTIRPLQNNNIPLLVKPFLNPTEAGTRIQNTTTNTHTQPAIIVKKNQALISIATKDLSFITENHLSTILSYFASSHLKINMMQLSALSFSACFDWDKLRFEKLHHFMQEQFNLTYQTELALITVQHFNPDLIKQLSANKTILMEQTSSNTAQIVLKELTN